MVAMTPLPFFLSFLCKVHFLSLSPISDLLCVVFICDETDKLRFLVPHALLSLSFLSLDVLVSLFVFTVLFFSSFCGICSSFEPTASCVWSKHFVDFCERGSSFSTSVLTARPIREFL